MRSTSRKAASRSSSASITGSKSIEAAKKYGFKVMTTAEAVKAADVIFVATPDLAIADVYKKDIEPNLTKGKTLLFSHGFAIHFKTVVPPKDIDVLMVAPKGPGHLVRRQYQEGRGVPALIAIYQNPSKQAKKIALAWAKGIGGTRAGVIETTFKEETETDLFGEQAVLCGGASALVRPATTRWWRPVTSPRWPTSSGAPRAFPGPRSAGEHRRNPGRA